MQKILFCLILFAIIRADIRFQDEQLLKSHHYHDSSLFNNDNTLNVHIIAHTHDDVGWLKTLDDYYYGNNNRIQWAGVQYTIDTVVQQLLKDPTKKFIYVEIAFFYRWWKQQTSELREKVKQLVKNGQLEFINAGWCMNDEATTYYEDIIDQMTIGHQFVLQNFGVIPTIGWHIDPFGHQASQAAIFSQMGFNAWFFARIDYQDKSKRLNNYGMEMVWHPKQQSGYDNYIFTHVQYFHYSPPPTFCYDKFCSDTPIADDPRLLNYNVDQRSEDLVYYFRNMSLHYRSNHLSHTFGSDFQFSAAQMWFKNLDKLIKYINENKEKFNMNIFYSTPSEYIKQINQQQRAYPKKFDDFFPYSDVPQGYWTGYFTSRVAIKGHVKQTGRYLQSVRTYLALLKIHNQSDFLSKNELLMQSSIDTLEQAMGVLQHHDAVAGTEKQHVANDYTFILQNATDTVNKVMIEVLKEQTNKQLNLTIDNFETCNWNGTASHCQILYNSLLNKQSVLLTAYSQMPYAISNYIRLKVPNAKFDVLAEKDGKEVVTDVICANTTDSKDCDAYFFYNLTSFSLTYFKIAFNDNPRQTVLVPPSPFGEFELEKVLKIGQKKEVRIFKFTNQFHYKQADQKQHKFKVDYNYYKSFQGFGQRSGAYIFRPTLDTYFSSIPYSTIKEKVGYVGRVMTSVHLIGDRTDSQVRFFADENVFSDNVVELETFIDSISIQNKRGKEIVLLVQNEDINNNKIFYTDSNGIELQERKLNYRPTWKLNVNEPTSGNYYPVNSMIQVIDKKNKRGMALLNDRSQGGTSLKEGQLELMIHRRLLHDDARGVGEPLNETEPWDQNKGLTQKVQHWIVFFDEGNEIEKQVPRLCQTKLDQKALLYYSQFKQEEILMKNRLKQQQESQLINHIIKFNGLSSFLDNFLKIYLRFNEKNQYLFRLQNLNEFQNLQVNVSLTSIKEMTLTANQLKSDWQKNRMKWVEENNDDSNVGQEQSYITPQFIEGENLTEDTQIDLKPLEIRTFIIQSQQNYFHEQQKL